MPKPQFIIMIIKEQKSRIIISLTIKEYDELLDIISGFDNAYEGVNNEPLMVERVKLARKWCKAFGLLSCAFVSKYL